MTHAGSAPGTTTAALTDLEQRLIYDVAQRDGQEVGAVALRYGVRFDDETGRLYRCAQDTES